MPRARVTRAPRVVDGVVNGSSWITVISAWFSSLTDRTVVDGLVNLVGDVINAIGERLRTVQTGYLRSYVLFLVLALVGIFALLSYFVSSVVAR